MWHELCNLSQKSNFKDAVPVCLIVTIRYSWMSESCMLKSLILRECHPVQLQMLLWRTLQQRLVSLSGRSSCLRYSGPHAGVTLWKQPDILSFVRRNALPVSLGVGRAAVLQEAQVLSFAVPEPGPAAQGLWSLPCRVSAGLGRPSPAPAGHLQPGAWSVSADGAPRLPGAATPRCSSAPCCLRGAACRGAAIFWWKNWDRWL